MTSRARKKPLWEPGEIPAAGALMDWRDGRHFDHRQDRPCALCARPTPMRSHRGEPAHKACAENWITAHPTEARLGRFAPDIQPKRDSNDDHA
ncbi:hypothetical protein FNH09_02120 [Streptomyces adustus]|uniref:Uncharacterized protein n=1 Tax=Streptomyces adustus TaxID=1609272 RepID=A0A5N8V4P7_9ACTN|nr:hypothetical protein [Streptomyces adustus]